VAFRQLPDTVPDLYRRFLSDPLELQAQSEYSALESHGPSDPGNPTLHDSMDTMENNKASIRASCTPENLDNKRKLILNVNRVKVGQVDMLDKLLVVLIQQIHSSNLSETSRALTTLKVG
jgi:hypothetical protein